jgi:hypothetical protein
MELLVACLMCHSLVLVVLSRLSIFSIVSGIQLKHLLLGKPMDPRNPSGPRYQDFWEVTYSHEFARDITVANNDEDDVSSSIRQV